MKEAPIFLSQIAALPYHIGNVIEDRSELLLQTPESFYARYKVNVKIKHEVVKIDPSTKTVTVKDLESSQEFSDSYDELILSPGAEPLRPPIPGLDAITNRVFTLRNVPDTDRIIQYIQSNKVKKSCSDWGRLYWAGSR